MAQRAGREKTKREQEKKKKKEGNAAVEGKETRTVAQHPQHAYDRIHHELDLSLLRRRRRRHGGRSPDVL